MVTGRYDDKEYMIQARQFYNSPKPDERPRSKAEITGSQEHLTTAPLNIP